jgi:hypothetical protein
MANDPNNWNNPLATPVSGLPGHDYHTLQSRVMRRWATSKSGWWDPLQTRMGPQIPLDHV